MDRASKIVDYIEFIGKELLENIYMLYKGDCMNKKFLGILIVGLLTGYSKTWGVPEQDAVNKANQDMRGKKSLGDIHDDIRSITTLIFVPTDPSWQDALLATLESLLDNLAERARQNLLKLEEKQEIIASLTSLSKSLITKYGAQSSEFVRQIIDPYIAQIKQVQSSAITLPVTPSIPLVPSAPMSIGSMEQLSARLMQLQQQLRMLQAMMPL